MKYFKIVLFACLFYTLFSFKLEIGTFPAKLFMNDFSKEGVSEWFVYEITLNLFLIFIACLGFSHPNKFVRNVFIAIGIDGVMTMFRFIIFGYYEPSYIAPITNAIPFSYIVYSYFVYGRFD